MFSFLSVGWGLMADIDIESERLRALGGQRFTIWAVHRLISLRTYRGRLSYLPATHLKARDTSSVYERKGSADGGAEKRRSSLKHSKSCTAALASAEDGDGDFKDSGEEDGGVCDACDMMEFGEVLSLETSISGGGAGNGFGGGRSRMDSFYSVGSKRSSYFSMTDSVYQDVHDGEDSGAFAGSGASAGGAANGVQHKVPMYGPTSNIPALSEPVPSSWTVMEGDFVMVHTAHLTHLGSDCYFAKQSQLNDGVIWMVVIKGGIPRTQLLSFLLGLSSGTHVPDESDYVKMIPCTAFRIEPEGNQGHLTVDGERVELGAIQGEVFDGMVNVTVPDVGE